RERKVRSVLAAVFAGALWLSAGALAQGAMPDIGTVGGMREACKHLIGEGGGAAAGQLLAFECDAHMSTVARPPGYKLPGKAPEGYCIPDDVAVAALATAFVRWADSREERWTGPAKAGTQDAFREAWPCQ
ncbi:MAG: hypothetical protein MJE66_02810, partial [Proteobacteria bacterium]|nr:hypothetical protein [Pseudomonadota bacterium]